jgi:hypothetical protein
MKIWARYALGSLFSTMLILSGCSSTQVDSTPPDRFAAKQYQSYSWRAALPTGMSGSMDEFYRLSTTVRDVVSEALEKKGYRNVESDGDFVISYAFKATLETGVDPTATEFNTTSAVINRGVDPAEAANAQALAGPREVASLLLLFEDGENLAPVWSATISQVVENRNQPDLEKVRRKLEPGVAKALRPLPNAR